MMKRFGLKNYKYLPAVLVKHNGFKRLFDDVNLYGKGKDYFLLLPNCVLLLKNLDL